MSGKPAEVRTREVVNVIKAAKRQGASKVEVRWGNASAVVHLHGNDDADNPSPEINEWDGAE